MGPERRQWIAAARALGGQPYAAMRAELPVGLDIALAIPALLDELVQLYVPLQEGCLYLCRLWLLTLFSAVHLLPPSSLYPA
jgi:hypothetical protein